MSFTFRGISSTTMGFNVTKRTVYTAPAYDVNAVEVPGRSGNVLIPQNRFKNKRVVYTGFLRADDFVGATKAAKLSAGLIALKGWLLYEYIAGEYQTLTDDYDPGFTRYAYVEGETSITDIQDRPEGAEISVTFDCQPFMYAPDDTRTATTGDISLTNPYKFVAYPTISVKLSSSTGTLTIKDGYDTVNVWTFTGTSGDSFIFRPDAMEWIDGYGNLVNNKVTLTNASPLFPILNPEPNPMTISTTGISNIEVKPNWRTL